LALVFTSVSFLFFFLPLFFVIYFLTPTIRGKNAVTLVFSLVFYAWGEPTFVLVLLASIALNTAAALLIDRREGRVRAAALGIAVTLNLLLLATFKYSTFIAENVNALLAPTGRALPVPNLALPLGISFFTFHGLSYLIDVYRRRFGANRNLSEVALYIALFPQLVAGPIVRYKTVAKQLHARTHRLDRITAGARIFIIGLAQKVLIADQVVPPVNVVFDHLALPTMGDAWIGLLAYTMQIYYDFAGYSNMAVGLGLIIGFSLPRNFRLPYTAQSITEFWRRWHISLSSWLRDYLYIPLGGNRGGVWQTYRNLITVFLLCGLWHGASWTYVLWGCYHGTFLVLERVGLARLLALLAPPLRGLYALIVVMGGWVLFRAHDLAAARRMYAGLLGRHGFGPIGFDVWASLQPVVLLALLVGALLAIVPRWVRLAYLPNPTRGAVAGAWSFGLLLLAMLSVAAGTYRPFLYFRF
jgi:D-alanyl-lipoteichoic acid acyltransferase DltB (MBOAT superfamily)